MPGENVAETDTKNEIPEPSPQEGGGPDLEKLARKVAELLLQEIKLENERTGKF